MDKIFPVLLVFFGECFVIIAEMMWPYFYKKYPISSFISIETCLLLLGGFLLIFGYIKGLDAFWNIWIISVCSLTTLLIVEPSIALLFYKHTPDLRTIVGFLLGVIGLIITVS